MEPLVSASAAAVVRPAPVLPSDLALLLRDGRLVAGELLAGPDDGHLLLALGRHRVPAQSDVRLEPGRTFLFRVEETRAGVVLHVLDGAPAAEPDLLRALRAVVAHERPLGEILSDLAARLRAQAALPEGAAPGRDAPLARALVLLLAAHAAGGEGGELPGGAGGASLLRELLERAGLRYEARLLAAARAGPGAEAAAHVAGDLKGELLRALRAFSDPGLREEVGRALAGLEAEQLLNVARERAGEPTVWSLPIPDADGRWSTLHLSVHEREGGGERQDGGKDAPLRVVLGLSLRHTGPLRVDLLALGASLSVRFLVESEALARRIAADAEEIAALLAAEGRSVQVAARAGSPDEIAAARGSLDTRFLAEHRLMDVSG